MTNSTKTASDTPTREEVAAVSVYVATAARTFVQAARAAARSFRREARDYVAAVAANGGKAAPVQRDIAEAVTAEGLTPYSQPRYSKLSTGWELATLAGLTVDGPDAPEDDAEALALEASQARAFDAAYALANASSSKVSADGKRAIAAEAATLPSEAERIAHIRAALEAPKAEESDAEESESESDAEETAETAEAETLADIAARIAEAIASADAIAAEADDADVAAIAAMLAASAERFGAIAAERAERAHAEAEAIAALAEAVNTPKRRTRTKVAA